ncbi:PREDICTED: serine/threonine-protein kinase prpf4B-like isoform X2 [Nelumbo nucifera]|uniref:non-specific serine/threonine protein kinase n=1 Tax=Nelumbo nucifera TaxID=4432 RepID=A0A1U8AM22_NELNU|nr:PREDICTED: serine/threonine-protein kinase prpf4B-like isoform X2 [Nelumbo nucifera]
MAGDEAETLKRHRRSPDEGTEGVSKRRKHSHRHHHSSSGGSHHRHHRRHCCNKSDNNSKHEEGDFTWPIAIVPASNSCPDDEKEEGEILEEEEEGYQIGDVAIVKKKTDSDIESGEIEPEEVADRSDNRGRDSERFGEWDFSSGKDQEELELNHNMLTENSIEENAQSSKASKDYKVHNTVSVLVGDRRDNDEYQLLECSDRKDVKSTLSKVDILGNSRTECLVFDQRNHGEAEIDGLSSEYEAFKSREKGEGRHSCLSSRDDMLNHDNGNFNHKFHGEDEKPHAEPISCPKETGKEKDCRNVQENVSKRHNRSRSPVTREYVDSSKKRKIDDQGAKTDFCGETEWRDSIRHKSERYLELNDADRIDAGHKIRSTFLSNDWFHKKVHTRDSSRSHGRSRERRSPSYSMLQEKSKTDSDHERVVRYCSEDRHSSRDWVKDREEQSSSSYRRYSGQDNRHGSRETRNKDRNRVKERDRAGKRDPDWDRNMERDRERDKEKTRNRDRDKGRDRETRCDRPSRHNYDGHEDDYHDQEKYKESRHSKYDELEQRDRVRTKNAPKVSNFMNGDCEGHEQKLQRDEEEDYEDKIALQLVDQEEEDLDRIKESRKRRQAILEKYKQQQLQQQVLSHSESLGKEENYLNVEKPSEKPPPPKTAVNVPPEAVESANENSDSCAVDVSFSVGNSPLQNGILAHKRTSGAVVLGDGSPKSERSDDMFCDDIFGESPAGIRKQGKGDGLQIERSGLHDNWDDAEGYYSYRFGEILDGRYEVTAAHGKGVFSTVVRVKDLKAGKGDPEEVAIKIIRNNETMYKAGMEELVILKKLAGADPEDRRHCVRFLSSFKYRNHFCLVFESLHMNLREVLKKFGRNIGLKLTAVRAYAKQLFIAVKHLRNCGVLHCDIKPDNMLVNEAKNVLKLCDFGNAMFAGKNEITPYLVSRFYRAPEIILGLPYDHPMDIWSVGCCLYELYSGKGAFTDQHFDQDLNFHATEEDPVTKKMVKRLFLNIKPKDIGSLITSSLAEDPKMSTNFKDLLERIFILDPEKRMTVSQALSHPFITGK